MRLETEKVKSWENSAPYDRILIQGLQRVFITTDKVKDFPACMNAAALLPGETKYVMISKLISGGLIARHSDYLVSSQRRLIRFHIPIFNEYGNIFIVWTSVGPLEICIDTGSAWYLPAELDHMCVNGSMSDRVNLIVDKLYDANMKEFIDRLL